MSCFAGNPDKLFDEFRKAPDVDYVKIPRFLMWIAGKAEYLNGVPLSGKINGLKVLSLGQTNDLTKEAFYRRLAEETQDYIDFINVKDGNDHARIFTKKDGRKYKNLYIIAGDSTDLAFVAINGKFTKEDLKKIMEE